MLGIVSPYAAGRVPSPHAPGVLGLFAVRRPGRFAGITGGCAIGTPRLRVVALGLGGGLLQYGEQLRGLFRD
jgi:hypothetical protein